MIIKTVIGALALTLSSTAFAAEPTTTAPKEECACCKKDESGKMTCADKHTPTGPTAEAHEGHGTTHN